MERKEEILLTMQRTIKNGVHYLCLLVVSYIDKSIPRHINYVAMQKTHIGENRRDLHFNMTSGVIYQVWVITYYCYLNQYRYKWTVSRISIVSMILEQINLRIKLWITLMICLQSCTKIFLSIILIPETIIMNKLGEMDF